MQYRTNRNINVNNLENHVNNHIFMIDAQKWIRINKLHLIAWLIYLVYEQLIILLLQLRPYLPLGELLHFLVHVSFFYLHALVTIPFIVKQRRMFLFGVLILFVQLSVYIFIQYGIDKFFVQLGYIKVNKPFILNYKVILSNLFRCLYFTVFATGYYFLENYISERRRVEILEREKLKAIIHQQKIEQELIQMQVAYLKAQINPHFLSNTLNFVYLKINDLSPVAGETIIRLSEMMNYAIGSNNMDNLILLKEEILQVENLIYIYKVRKGESLHLTFNYDEQVSSFHFIPMVLLTLTENVFKHGDLSHPNHPAHIEIGVNNNLFYIQTRNLVGRSHHGSHHTGIKNMTNRLVNTYGNYVDFKTENEGAYFNTRLIIPQEHLRAFVSF